MRRLWMVVLVGCAVAPEPTLADYRIVLSRDASPVERTAAEEPRRGRRGAVSLP